MSLHRLDPEAEAAVDGVACSLLDNVRYSIENREIEDTREMFEVISDTDLDDTLAIDLSLDERLSLAENYADDYGLELGDVTIHDLRTRIETLAVLVIHQLGLDRAYGHLVELETAMNDHGLAISQVRSDNPHGWARHYAEREEGSFQVYEYRNLEGERIHIDLWEYHAIPGCRFYFEVPVDPEDVSEEENRFDAN